LIEKEVFFIELSENSKLEERVAAAEKIISFMKFENYIAKKDKVAIKLHVGEKNNTTHISPEVIKTIVDEVKNIGGHPFLTETSTLYHGSRSNAIEHLALAFEHGFTFENTGAPFIMADGLLGNSEMEVSIQGILFKKVNIAREIMMTDAMVLVSHPTGHLATGMAGAIKNLGMGFASRKGKLKQHSSIKPYIKAKLCNFCEQCFKYCPADAIIEKDKKAFIITEKCIGCGECLTICNYNAVKYNWGKESAELQKSMAEYALGAIIQKKQKCLYLNVLANMTKLCDCMDVNQKRIINDIGILGSDDPVALDQATLDLTKIHNKKDLGEMSFPNIDPVIQLEHAEKIGLGSRKYRLININ